MNLALWLHRNGQLHSQRHAVFFGEECVATYGQLAQRAAALGASLQARLPAGERVAIFLTNTPNYIEILLGCWYAGLVVVPINCKLHPREVSWIVEHSGAALLFTESTETGELTAAKGRIDIDSNAYQALFSAAELEAPVNRQPHDLAWLFYTSGTTGRPKGVMLTHRNLMTMTLAYFSSVDHCAADDAALYAAPMSHGAGMYLLPHLLAGARHVIPRSRGFEPGEILDLADKHGQLSLFAAPTMVKRLVDRVERDQRNCAGIKTIVYGGGPMYVEDIHRALTVMGPRFVQIFGQGESPMTITSLRREQLAQAHANRDLPVLGSVGSAQAPVDVRIADADGKPLPIGEIGEVLVRGDTVMAGYWNNPEATTNTIRDGWLFTGDMGVLDAAGFLTLKDRSKDMIISGGSNIYPREVEEVLLQHPAVAEVAVIGVPDPEWGEVVVACVVLRADMTVAAAELDSLCQQHIARFKRPKHYQFLPALPKNNYGKVLKTELRQRHAESQHSLPPTQ